MKTYTLKSRGSYSDLTFTIADLVPLSPSRYHDYDRLIKLISYRDYETDWSQPMEEDYEQLYSRKAHTKVDFFKIRGTDIIVMPGDYIYPTILSEEEVTAFTQEINKHYC